jgi:maleylacetate reductase
MVRTGRVAFTTMDEVRFGAPAAESLAALAERYDARRVMLMASATMAARTDEVAKIEEALGTRLAHRYTGMPAHSPRAAVIDAVNAAQACQADLIVTFGGGSLTDAAKAVGLCLANGIETAEEIDRLKPVAAADGVVGPPPGLNPPTIGQISIPTTLSGGEFSAMSGVTDERSNHKDILRHPGMMPRAVILDPAVTVHTPEWLWLSTGIRAVDHCVEGICSNASQPYGDAQAVQGLALLASGLRAVKRDPANIAARLDCQLGTWLSMGALVSGVPMGASHGIGYVLGAAFDVPHGHTSCVMLPAVMRWNADDNLQRQRIVSAALGQPDVPAADLLAALIGDLGMPLTLRDVGVGPEHFEMISERAMATPWVPHNPKPIAGPPDVLEILNLAA